MASSHVQNSDDYGDGKFGNFGECQGVNNIPRGGGGVRVTFATKRNSLRGRRTKILSLPYRFGYTIAMVV